MQFDKPNLSIAKALKAEQRESKLLFLKERVFLLIKYAIDALSQELFLVSMLVLLAAWFVFAIFIIGKFFI